MSRDVLLKMRCFEEKERNDKIPVRTSSYLLTSDTCPLVFIATGIHGKHGCTEDRVQICFDIASCDRYKFSSRNLPFIFGGIRRRDIGYRSSLVSSLRFDVANNFVTSCPSESQHGLINLPPFHHPCRYSNKFSSYECIIAAQGFRRPCNYRGCSVYQPHRDTVLTSQQGSPIFFWPMAKVLRSFKFIKKNSQIHRNIL